VCPLPPDDVDDGVRNCRVASLANQVKIIKDTHPLPKSFWHYRARRVRIILPKGGGGDFVVDECARVKARRIDVEVRHIKRQFILDFLNTF
jgi:hypothetical protein